MKAPKVIQGMGDQRNGEPKEILKAFNEEVKFWRGFDQFSST